MTAISTAPAGSGLSFTGILRSEWIKLRSLRSTVWCYAVIVVMTIGLGAILSATAGFAASMPHDAQQGVVVQVATLGISFSQLVAAVLGALVITGEYGTGMIRSTLTAVPKRTPALLAKSLVFGVVTFVVSLFSFVVTVFVTAPILPRVGIHPDLGDAHLWLALLGGAGYLALLGMLSLAIGTMIRNSAGGIATSLGLILVVPLVLQLIGAITRSTWPANVAAYLPGSVGERMYAYIGAATQSSGVVVSGPGTGVVLDPWQAGLVLVAWVVVTTFAAAVLLKRRDA